MLNLWRPTRATAGAPRFLLGSLLALSVSLPPTLAAQGGGPATTSRKAQPDTIVTIVVPATVPWTDTGIIVSAGDGLAVRSWGRVMFDAAAGASASPQGSGRKGGGCTFVVTDAGVAAHSVIGNVAQAIMFDGHGFPVGAAWKGTVPIPGSTAPEGHLLLGFNDDGVLCDRSGYDSWGFGVNNSGWFTAEISITRARKARPE